MRKTEWRKENSERDIKYEKERGGAGGVMENPGEHVYNEREKSERGQVNKYVKQQQSGREKVKKKSVREQLDKERECKRENRIITA